MAKKKIPKTTKRRLAFLVPIAMFVIGYCLFTLITTGISLYSLNKEERQLNSELNHLKSDAKSLKTEITKLQNKDYVARYARENYLYTKDGEYVIKVNDNNEKQVKPVNNQTEQYIIYGCAALTLIICLFVIVKSRKNKVKKKKRN